MASSVAGAAPEVRSRVGRDGFLRLAFARRGAATVLVERRFRTPLQVLEALTFAGDPASGILLLNPTGGVLGGDRLCTEVSLAAGAHVLVSTPSATRVYGTRGPAAVQETTAWVGAEGVLEYLPDHVIPHPRARFEQRLEVALAAGARLLLWDAWALGRPARGELWTFDGLVGSVRVTREGTPLFVDRMILDPRQKSLAARTGTQEHAYVATWLVAADGVDAGVALADELGDAAAKVPGVRAAGSHLAGGGVLVRVLSLTAYGLLEAQLRLWALSRARVLGLPPLDLRKA